MLWAANAMAYALAYGDDEDEWDEKLKKYLTDPEHRAAVREKEKMEREHLPEYLKGSVLIPAWFDKATGFGIKKTVRLGTDEVTQLPMFIDISRMIPGGDIMETHANAGGVEWLPQSLTPNNPLLTAAVGMLANRDLYFGKDLTDSNDTSGEKFEKRASWIWRQLAPAIAVNQYHWSRTLNAIAHTTGEEITWLPDLLGGDATGIGRDGLPVQAHLAAAQTFGIKIRPYDLDRSEDIENSAKKKLLREIDAELTSLRRLNSLGAIPDRAYEKARDLADTKKDRLREGLTVDGEERD